MLSNRFDEALVFASNLHRAQLRKGSNIPYISHLLAVSALVIENKGNEDQAIAGLLHDAAEDQGGKRTLEIVRDKFGTGVAEIVEDCTDAFEMPKPPWRERKEAYLGALPKKPSTSLLVSLADKVHNAKSIVDDRGRVGEEIWQRFTGGKEGTVWYYDALAKIFVSALPGALADELSRQVHAMKD
jgi:(p)ppGpp synthase/HD superfamily hydrolase